MSVSSPLQSLSTFIASFSSIPMQSCSSVPPKTSLSSNECFKKISETLDKVEATYQTLIETSSLANRSYQGISGKAALFNNDLYQKIEYLKAIDISLPYRTLQRLLSEIDILTTKASLPAAKNELETNTVQAKKHISELNIDRRTILEGIENLDELRQGNKDLLENEASIKKLKELAEQIDKLGEKTLKATVYIQILSSHSKTIEHLHKELVERAVHFENLVGSIEQSILTQKQVPETSPESPSISVNMNYLGQIIGQPLNRVFNAWSSSFAKQNESVLNPSPERALPSTEAPVLKRTLSDTDPEEESFLRQPIEREDAFPALPDFDPVNILLTQATESKEPDRF